MKKIRLTLTQVIEYEPNPNNYPEGMSIEQMAQLDADTDDIDLTFSGELEDIQLSWEVINEDEKGNRMVLDRGKGDIM